MIMERRQIQQRYYTEMIQQLCGSTHISTGVAIK